MFVSHVWIQMSEMRFDNFSSQMKLNKLIKHKVNNILYQMWFEKNQLNIKLINFFFK